MPSTYTVNLGIEKPATGEQSGTWGDTTNINFDILDQAINGCLSLTLASAGTSGSPNTLAISDGATSDGRNKWIEFVDGGDLGATAYVQLTPNDAEKIVFVRNSLSGSRSVILFQGTYDAGRDLEVPAGVDMVVKFSGGGATATATDVFTRLRVTAIETPSLTATTADINGGTIDGTTVGASSASTGAFTTLTASTSLNIASSTTVDGVLDEDDMSSDSATKLATQQSIKAYVDSQVGTVDTLAEILANGNTSGANNLIIDNGQAITTNTVNETTAGSGVTIDSVLLKDDGVNATNLEITNLKANDGTAAGSIANSTGAVTITSFISNSVDIGGGAIDGTNIGASTAGSGAFTTLSASGNTTLGDASTDTVTVNGYMAIGGSPYSGIAAYIRTSGLQQTSQVAIQSSITANSTATSLYGLLVANSTEAASFNVGSVYGIRSNNVTLGAGSSATNQYGLYIPDLTSATNNYGITSLVSSGTNKWNIYASGTAANYFAGDVTLGNGATLKMDDQDSITFGTFSNSTSGVLLQGGTSTSFLAYQAGKIRMTLGTTEAVFNDPGNDVDFRVESDSNTHALFVDASANSVAMGTSAPANYVNTGGLAVQGSTYSDLALVSTNISSGNNSHQIRYYNATGTDYEIARTRVNVGAGQVNRGEYQFSVNNGAGLRPWLDVDYAGNVVFNQQGYDSDFRVESDTNANAFIVDASQDNVGIGGTPNAGTKLDVYQPVTTNQWTGRVVSRSDTAGAVWLGTYTSGSQSTTGIYAHDSALSAWADLYINAHGDGSGGTSSGGTGQTIHSVGTWSHNGNVVINDASFSTYDFRVESDSNTHMLFVDAGADTVGIRNATPQTTFVVNVDGATGSTPGDYWDLDKWFLVADGEGNSSSGLGITHGESFGTKIVSIDPYTAWRDIDMIGDTLRYYQGGTNLLMSINNTNIIFNENSLNADFRVESDSNTHMLFVDAGNNLVGIGTSSVNSFYTLGVNGGILATGDHGLLNDNNEVNIFHNLASNSQIYFGFDDLASGFTIQEYGFYSGQGTGTFVPLLASAFTVSSDYRLKQNVTSLSDGITRLKQLLPKRFTWVENNPMGMESTQVVDGFLAHEVQDVIPEAVHGEKDAEIGEKGEGYQRLDQAKLVPLLTAALQEAVTKIETLEARIAALENA